MREPTETTEDSVTQYRSKLFSLEFPADSTLSEVSLCGSGRHLRLTTRIKGKSFSNAADNLESPSRRRAKKRAKSFNRVIWALAIISVLGAMVSLYAIFGNQLFRDFVHFLKRTIHSGNPFTYVILVGIQFLFAFVLFMPGLSTLNILTAFFLHSFWIAFGVIFGASYVASLSVYLTASTCCKKKMHKKMSHLIIYKMLIKETKKHPYKTGILFNFLFVPVSLKNYLIGLSELKFHHACIVFLPGNALLCGICAMIGSKVNDLSEIFGSKSFSSKTKAEKIQFVISMSLLAFTLAFLCMLFCVIKRQYTKYQEAQVREEEEAERLHKGRGELFTITGSTLIAPDSPPGLAEKTESVDPANHDLH